MLAFERDREVKIQFKCVCGVSGVSESCCRVDADYDGDAGRCVYVPIAVARVVTRPPNVDPGNE